jgi:hypothetical protein
MSYRHQGRLGGHDHNETGAWVNNNFARKIEGQLLETHYLKHARSRMWVPNKRGHVPPMTGVLPTLGRPVDVWLDGSRMHFGAKDGEVLRQIEKSILSADTRTDILPISTGLDRHLMSRFLGKVAIEGLASRLMRVEGWREEILGLEGLEQLRRYVRRGDAPPTWEFSQRRLYTADAVFTDGTESFEVLHEFAFVHTQDHSLFFVIAIFGEEFAIDMGDAAIAGYLKWLDGNGNQSPLCSLVKRLSASLSPHPFSPDIP